MSVVQAIHEQVKKIGAFDDEQVKRLQYVLIHEWKIKNNEITILLEDKKIQIKTFSEDGKGRFKIIPKTDIIEKLKLWLVTDFDIEFI